MTTKETLLISLAVIWVVLLFFIVTAWMKAAPPMVKTAGKVEILVAANPINAHQPLSVKDIRWQEISADQVQAEDIKHEPQAVENYLGRQVLINLGADQIIKKNYFAPQQAQRMAQLIRPGKYAMTVALSKNNSENLFIVPGDNVDVFLTRPISNDPNRLMNEFITRLLLTDVRVLAVDKAMTQEPQVPQTKPTTQTPEQKTLTLEVDTAQAKLLALGMSIGTISFALRTEAGSAPDNSSPMITSKSLGFPQERPIIEYHGAKIIQRGS